MRTLREEPKFKEQIEALAIDFERFDEVMRGVHVSLCLSPETFEQVGPLSVLKTDMYPGAPALRIFFTYTDTEVHLLFVEFAEDT